MITSKSIAGILFILLLLTDKSVLKEILKFRTLLLFAAWLVFCYPLADADYMLERYLYDHDENGTYEDIVEQAYYVNVELRIDMAVRFKDSPDQYRYYCWTPEPGKDLDYRRQSSALDKRMVLSNMRRVIRPISKIVFNEEAIVRQAEME